jgi:hypothetical protein
VTSNLASMRRPRGISRKSLLDSGADDLVALPLTHENKQVGWLIECPECHEGIRVPVFEMQQSYPEDAWIVPPQNAAVADGGWFHAWGTELNVQALDLRVPAGIHEPSPGPDHQIVCTPHPNPDDPNAPMIGCGRGFVIREGTIQEIE